MRPSSDLAQRLCAFYGDDSRYRSTALATFAKSVVSGASAMAAIPSAEALFASAGTLGRRLWDAMGQSTSEAMVASLIETVRSSIDAQSAVKLTIGILVVVAVLYQIIRSATRPAVTAYAVAGRLLAIVWIVAVVGLVDNKIEESVGQSAIALCVEYTGQIFDGVHVPAELGRARAFVSEALTAYDFAAAPLATKLRDRFEAGMRLPMAKMIEAGLREAGADTDLARYATMIDAMWACMFLAMVFDRCKAVAANRPGVLTFLTKAAIVGTSVRLLHETRGEEALEAQLVRAMRAAQPLLVAAA